MSAARASRRVRQLFRDYTGGRRLADIVRELERDAGRSYRTLTRDHAGATEPRGRVRRCWHRITIVFLGLSSKLSPARRTLFAICLALALFGTLRISSFSGDAPSGTWFLLASVAGTVFLLALELADRAIVRDELEVARQLQQELLPCQAPELPGWEFAFSYRTANTIGGDYYDFIPLRDGRVALVIGDASGHGIAAGLLMAIASSTLKLALDLDPHPVVVASLVNRAIVRTGTTRDFMTLFVGLLQPATGAMEYVCAGHPFPVIRHADGSHEEMGTGSLPLGMWEEVAFDVGQATVRPGDLLFLYSDGIPETVDDLDRAYGFERLREQLATGGSARQVHDRIVQSVSAFRGNRPLLDDLSLVVVTRAG